DDTTVTGVGFAPNSPVQVQLVDGAGNPVGEPVALTSDENGGFTTPLTVPEGTTPGEYGVKAVDGEGNEDTAPLTVTEPAAAPSVTVDPTSVPAGDDTTVTGEGFAPNSPVTVQLEDANGNPVGDPVQVTTDENGNFTTPLTVPEGTTPGDYSVVATDDQGGEAETPLTVTDGAAGPGSIGDRVWSDLDSDGVQDAGEPGLAGVTVNLLDGQGAPVNGADGQPVTATTDENGAYLFEGLQLGGYVVEFAGLPQGASFSPAGAGDDTTVDSDAGENGRSAVVTLTAEVPANLDVDAGVVGAPVPTEPTVTV
ncbi:SdrD B-like domain-containing protein, partial [Arthrobacter sp. SW1]|uniref:SdrD B-like domain-containing protein n=1 Tax=Arthrobacter sp. SW1 TaxID=1920889 RepID=UPI0025B74680